MNTYAGKIRFTLSIYKVNIWETMPGVRKRGEEVRDFILTNITENRNIAA